jgi:hypothetical protein
MKEFEAFESLIFFAILDEARDVLKEINLIAICMHGGLGA